MIKRLRWVVIVAGTLALALVLAACSNASTTATTVKPGTPLPKTGPAPGVTSNSIIVGTLATESGALSPGFGEIVDGVEAYFDMVNAEGGVNGRKIDLKYNLDDQANTTNDETQARNLVEQDHVFAVVGVGTPFFYGSTFLTQSKTPTFGYVVTSDWNNSPYLFGAYGSYLDYNTESPTAAFLAKAVGAKSVAVLAYSFAPSKDPCQDVVNGLSRFGVHVGFQDLNFSIGGNATADVQQMVSKHVDMTFSCMEGNGQPVVPAVDAPVRADGRSLRLVERVQPVVDRGEPHLDERGHLRRPARALRGGVAVPRRLPGSCSNTSPRCRSTSPSGSTTIRRCRDGSTRPSSSRA